MNTENLERLVRELDMEASVTHAGITYRFRIEDIHSLTWSDTTDSTSFRSALVSLGKANWEAILGRSKVIELCAATLRITPTQLEEALEWNANYMAWHDGGSADENHTWSR